MRRKSPGLWRAPARRSAAMARHSLHTHRHTTHSGLLHVVRLASVTGRPCGTASRRGRRWCRRGHAGGNKQAPLECPLRSQGFLTTCFRPLAANSALAHVPNKPSSGPGGLSQGSWPHTASPGDGEGVNSSAGAAGSTCGRRGSTSSRWQSTNAQGRDPTH